MKKFFVVALTFTVIAATAIYFFYRGSEKEVESEQDTKSETTQKVSQISPVDGLLRVDLMDPDVVGSKRRLWIDLPFALVKSRAEQGDAEAQWQVSQMYDYCLMYNLKPQATLSGFDDIAKLRSQNKKHIDRIKRELVERCATVDGGQPIPGEAVKLWLEESAKQGVLAAKLRQATLAQEGDPQKLLSYVDDVKRSKSPREVFEMGTLARLIEPHWKEEKTAAAFSDGKYAQYAWELAACRSGLDCSQSSMLMYWACYQGGCAYDNYEQYVLNTHITPAGRGQLEESIRIIQENFLK